MGIAKLAVLGESGDKRLRITTVPGVNVAAYNLGGFHQLIETESPVHLTQRIVEPRFLRREVMISINVSIIALRVIE
ncbi:MAG TPA: hypothetical protein VIS99_03445 [Terrimicrobiaceae bacterium]